MQPRITIAAGFVLTFATNACSGPTTTDAAVDHATSDIVSDATMADDVQVTPDATMADVLRPPPINRTQSEAALSAQRRSCAFGAGAWPAETLGTEFPIGEDIPINHVIVIVQENRSFDHYL